MGRLFKGLALATVFIVLAMICAKLINGYLGFEENIIWFIFEGAYIQVTEKFNL